MKHIKKIFLLLSISLFLFFPNGFSQKQGYGRIDSLLNKLPTLREDTSKVLLLIDLSYSYRSINADSGLHFGQMAYDLAANLKWNKGIAGALAKEGNNYFIKSDYKKALELLNRSLQLNTQINNKSGIAGNYLSIGLVYNYSGDYLKAIYYYDKSLKLYEELNDWQGIAKAYGNMGFAYDGESNYTEALEYDLKSLKINEEIGNKSGIAVSLTNAGNIYMVQSDYTKATACFLRARKLDVELGHKGGAALSGLGKIYMLQRNYDAALQYLFLATDEEKQMGNNNIVAKNYGIIGDVYSDEKKFSPAFNYYLKSLWLALKLSNAHLAGICYYRIGDVYLNALLSDSVEILNKVSGGNKSIVLKQSEMYLDSSLAMREQINELDIMESIYKDLSQIEKMNGNFATALDNYQKYSATKDSIFDIEKNTKITQLSMQYDFNKKQDSMRAEQNEINLANENEKQRLRIIRNSFIGGFSLMFIASGIFFMQRRRISKEKKRSDELLLNILPSEVAEELKDKGSADAKAFDDVTVIFTDFKDFTGITEKLSAKELVAEIDYCFKGFDNIIHKYGIEKIKTIGDSYMAVGGLPVANKTHAKDVVSAALEIVQFMEAHKQQRLKENKPVFEIRIGINTGPVVAGIVGVKKFAYDIWGDTVNLASRMESGGESGKINISGSTYELVKNDFTCTYRGKIQAKNKGEVDMYFVQMDTSGIS